MIYKRHLFSIWFTIFAFVVSLNNSLGTRFDDKNLLLYFTSPPLWILEDYSYLLRELFGESLMFTILRGVNILFWFTVGFLIDWRVSKSQGKISLTEFLMTHPVASIILFILLLFSLAGTVAAIILFVDGLMRLA